MTVNERWRATVQALRARDALVWLILAGLGVAVFVAFAAAMHEIGFPLDDAWIHQTYARNLARHGEWAFVPGEPSAASTSPLFTLVLAAGRVIGIPFYVWTFGIGALTLGTAAWVSVRLGETLFPALRSAQVGLWTGGAVVLTWHLVWAAASGMETMLFTALSVVFVWRIWQDAARSAGTGPPVAPGVAFRRGLGAGVLGALLTVTRPEGAGLVGLGGLFFLLAWPLTALPGGWRVVSAWGSGLALGWLVGVVPYALLNYDTEGSLLPTTSEAKQSEYAALRDESLLVRYARLLIAVMAGGQFMLIPGMVAGIWHVVRRARQDPAARMLLLPLAWALMDLTAYALRLPAQYQHGRYVIPILPHLIVYGVGGTLLIVQAGRHQAWQRVATRSLALTAVLIMPGFFVIGAEQYGRDVRIINTEMVATAHWVADNLAADELLAVHDIGALGYYAPRPILDLAGLVSPEVIPIIRDHEALMTLMCERGVRYLMVMPAQRPAEADDPRLGRAFVASDTSTGVVVQPLFITGAPYAPAAGGGNMAVYEMNWPVVCE